MLTYTPLCGSLLAANGIISGIPSYSLVHRVDHSREGG